MRLLKSSRHYSQLVLQNLVWVKDVKQESLDFLKYFHLEIGFRIYQTSIAKTNKQTNTHKHTHTRKGKGEWK